MRLAVDVLTGGAPAGMSASSWVEIRCVVYGNRLLRVSKRVG